MLLEKTRRTLDQAASELAVRGLPNDVLRRLIAEIDELAAGAQESSVEPYLIPNDISLCTETSVLNFSPIDFELDLPRGFSIQAAARQPTSFARPYYIDPVRGVRRCRGLFALESYEDRREWEFDFAFVGHRGFHTEHIAAGPRAVLADRLNTRYVFLQRFAHEYVPARDLSVQFHLNDAFFFSDPSLPQDERDRLNRIHRYIPSIRDSRFVLCPRGRGPNSIRFFETVACANVPVFVGEPETHLPLDWIIDWDYACVRIDGSAVADGSYAEALDRALAMPLDDVNERRRYIFDVYHQLLAPERVRVFEQLVLLRVSQLLAEKGSVLAVTPGRATDRPAVP